MPAYVDPEYSAPPSGGGGAASTTPPGGATGTSIPGAGVYGQNQAVAQNAYQQALASIAQDRGHFLSSSGLMLGPDGRLVADPNATYGGYQQLLAGQGFDQRQAQLNFDQTMGGYNAQLGDIQAQAAMAAADAQAAAADAAADAQFRAAGAQGDYRMRMRDFQTQETQGRRDHEFTLEDLQHMLSQGTQRLGEDFTMGSGDLAHDLQSALGRLGVDRSRALRDSGLTESGEYDLAGAGGEARKLQRQFGRAMDEADAEAAARGLGTAGLGAQGSANLAQDLDYSVDDLRTQLLDHLTDNTTARGDAQYAHDRGLQGLTRTRDRGLEDIQYEHSTGTRRANTRLEDLITAVTGGREDAAWSRDRQIEAANRAASSAASSASRRAAAANSAAARQAANINRLMGNAQADYALNQERASYGSGASLADFLSGAGRTYSGFGQAEAQAFNTLQNANQDALLNALLAALSGGS